MKRKFTHGCSFTGCGKKNSDIYLQKILVFRNNILTLIVFKQVPLGSDWGSGWDQTLLTTFLPLLEAALERIFWDSVQLVRCILHNTLYGLIAGPFQGHFMLTEKPEITRTDVSCVGSVTTHMIAVFCNEI